MSSVGSGAHSWQNMLSAAGTSSSCETMRFNSSAHIMHMCAN